jgi:hypothetical protein
LPDWDFIRSLARAALPLAALCCLCACASQEAAQSGKLSDTFATPEWAKFTSTAPSASRRTVTQNDLITADGRCAALEAPMQATDGSAPPESADAALAGQGPLPGVQGGVALGMSECEIMQRTGSPDRFDIGAEGGDRIMTMTVTRGPNPGLYRFRGGRLTSVDRVEVPAPPKPTKQKSPARKQSSAQRSAQ